MNKTKINLKTQSADFTTDAFTVDTYQLYGIQVLTEGSGFSYDLTIEVSNTPTDDDSWGLRTDTSLTALNQDSSPVSYDFETGIAYARFKVTNLTGTIDSFKVTVNK